MGIQLLMVVVVYTELILSAGLQESGEWLCTAYGIMEAACINM
jgi:hypothetical protein